MTNCIFVRTIPLSKHFSLQKFTIEFIRACGVFVCVCWHQRRMFSLSEYDLCTDVSRAESQHTLWHTSVTVSFRSAWGLMCVEVSAG